MGSSTKTVYFRGLLPASFGSTYMMELCPRISRGRIVHAVHGEGAVEQVEHAVRRRERRARDRIHPVTGETQDVARHLHRLLRVPLRLLDAALERTWLPRRPRAPILAPGAPSSRRRHHSYALTLARPVARLAA